MESAEPKEEKKSSSKTSFVIVIVVVVIILLFLIVWRMRREPPKSSNVVEASPELRAPGDILVESENGNIFAKWDEVPGADSYIMYFSNKSGFTLDEARTIEGITEGQFTITKVPPGTYYYRVASISNSKPDAKSKWSEERVITVGKCAPPSAPKDVVVSVNNEDPTEVLISWTPDTTGDGYILYVNRGEPPTGHDGNTLSVKIDDPSKAEHSLQGVTTEKWYAAVACVSNYCGLGELSTSVALN